MARQKPKREIDRERAEAEEAKRLEALTPKAIEEIDPIAVIESAIHTIEAEKPGTIPDTVWGAISEWKKNRHATATARRKIDQSFQELRRNRKSFEGYVMEYGFQVMRPGYDPASLLSELYADTLEHIRTTLLGKLPV